MTLNDSQQKEGKEGSEKGVWSVYTPHNHTSINSENDDIEDQKTVEIILGDAQSNGRESCNTKAQEKVFSYRVITKSLTIKVKNMGALIETD